MFTASPLFAQSSPQDRERINRLTSADHKLMMDKLGISSIRRGPSGNPQAPDAANSDEAKVQPYFLPNPLEFNDGSKVSTPAQWQARRAEIKEFFDREIYGRLPDHVPSVTWKVVSEQDSMDGQFPVKIKKLEGTVDNASYPQIDVVIQLTVGTPAGTEKPVPLIMEFGFDFQGQFGMPRQTDSNVLTWKQQLLKEGWGYAILNPGSYQADNGAGLTEGIIGLVNKGQPRKPDDWGSLRAWAWGARLRRVSLVRRQLH
jgi:hypothetical protein